MKIATFSTKPYDQQYLDQANGVSGNPHEITYYEYPLNKDTAMLAQGFDAVCAFVNDHLNRECFAALKENNIQHIAMRCAGFNNVDLDAAKDFGISVQRVPEYSPYAVAEYSIALLLDVNRRIARAFRRVRDGDFSLQGLLGFDLHGKTVGIIGTGKIGQVAANILLGFGCKVIAYDLYPNEGLKEKGVKYENLENLFKQSDVISLYCPLTLETFHMINEHSVRLMKKGVYIINTSRGGLVNTDAVIEGLKSKKIGGLALDVYEEEEGVFFEDLSDEIIHDDKLMRLTTFPNVIITSHQAFFTQEALERISSVTINNLSGAAEGRFDNEVL
ncbi:MAG: 2-hydroxyacid dehydrogenase [Alphaproteobacteria bacterium]